MEHSQIANAARTGITHRAAQGVMALIIAFNVLLGFNLLAAGDSAFATILNSQNVYAVAGCELVVLFAAYLAAKYEPIPTPA